MPFTAPDAWRHGDLLLRPFQPGDGAELNRATQSSLEHGIAEVGMWVRADEAGRGLGTRVLQAMVDWADAAWPWRRLVWTCDGRNVASARVADKCGFRLEGRLREPVAGDPLHRGTTLVYGLLAADPRPWRGGG